MIETYSKTEDRGEIVIDEERYANYKEDYKKAVLAAIEKEKQSHE